MFCSGTRSWSGPRSWSRSRSCRRQRHKRGTRPWLWPWPWPGRLPGPGSWIAVDPGEKAEPGTGSTPRSAWPWPWPRPWAYPWPRLWPFTFWRGVIVKADGGRSGGSVFEHSGMLHLDHSPHVDAETARVHIIRRQWNMERISISQKLKWGHRA